MLNFTCLDKPARIYRAEASIVMGTRTRDLTFRIDGRSGVCRVDVVKPLFPMWEAIDGGEGFRTVREAKAFVARWIRAAKAQNSLSPDLAKNGT